MKTKLLYIGLSAALALGGLTSCKKYLDVNTNPNTATAVEPKLLFSTAAVQYINERAGGDLWIPVALGSQTVSSGGNNPTGWGIPYEEQYVFDPLIFGNPWRYFYTTIGAGLKQAISLAQAASPVNNNAAAQCKVLFAIDLYDATTLYGDIPYSEAIKDGVSYPKFDGQQQVLEQIVTLLDEAYAQFDESSPLKIGADYDLMYKGVIASWKKLARSVKLRTLMTLVDKDPTKAAAIGQMITEGGMISAANETAQIAFSDVQGRKNPKNGMQDQLYGGINPFHASKRVVDFMNAISDPRLPFYFDKPAAQATYIGLANGATGVNSVNARVSTTLHKASEPEVFFSYQEQLFFEAEIYARGLGVAVDLTTATTKLQQAVAESAKYYGVTAGVATTFGNSIPSLTTFGTNREAVKYIHMHHWVDEMDRPLEAFVQWRRSGPEGDEVPELTLPIGAQSGGLFRRYEYPQTNEILANPNAPKARIKYDAKMWFDL